MRHSSHRLLSWRSLVYQLSVQKATLRHLQHDRRRVAFWTRGSPSASRHYDCRNAGWNSWRTKFEADVDLADVDVHLEVAEHHEIFFTKYYGLDAVAVQLWQKNSRAKLKGRVSLSSIGDTSTSTAWRVLKHAVLLRRIPTPPASWEKMQSEGEGPARHAHFLGERRGPVPVGIRIKLPSTSSSGGCDGTRTQPSTVIS